MPHLHVHIHRGRVRDEVKHDPKSGQFATGSAKGLKNRLKKNAAENPRKGGPGKARAEHSAPFKKGGEKYESAKKFFAGLKK